MARDADGDGDLYDDDSDAQNGVESWNVYFVQDYGGNSCWSGGLGPI
jgi:hypothetical protein